MSPLLAPILATFVILVSTQAMSAEWAMHCRYFTDDEQPYIDLKFRMYDHETFYEDVEVTLLQQDKISRRRLVLRPPDGEELFAIDIGRDAAEGAFSLIIRDEVVGEIAGIEQWPSTLWLSEKPRETHAGYCFAVEARGVGA